MINININGLGHGGCTRLWTAELKELSESQLTDHAASVSIYTSFIKLKTNITFWFRPHPLEQESSNTDTSNVIALQFLPFCNEGLKIRSQS